MEQVVECGLSVGIVIMEGSSEPTPQGAPETPEAASSDFWSGERAADERLEEFVVVVAVFEA